MLIQIDFLNAAIVQAQMSVCELIYQIQVILIPVQQVVQMEMLVVDQQHIYMMESLVA